MNRRELLQRLAIVMGGAAISPTLAEAFHNYPTDDFTSIHNIADPNEALLDEIAEVIIPTTNTPGAKAAKVGAFIVLIMQDCTKEPQRKKFYDGLAAFEADCKTVYGKSFMALSNDQRIEALKKAEATAMEARKNPASNGSTFFSEMKGLTMSGYFTSEIGCTQALEYVPVPGAYRACEPLKPGQRAWAI